MDQLIMDLCSNNLVEYAQFHPVNHINQYSKLYGSELWGLGYVHFLPMFYSHRNDLSIHLHCQTVMVKLLFSFRVRRIST